MCRIGVAGSHKLALLPPSIAKYARNVVLYSDKDGAESVNKATREDLARLVNFCLTNPADGSTIIRTGRAWETKGFMWGASEQAPLYIFWDGYQSPPIEFYGGAQELNLKFNLSSQPSRWIEAHVCFLSMWFWEDW